MRSLSNLHAVKHDTVSLLSTFISFVFLENRVRPSSFVPKLATTPPGQVNDKEFREDLSSTLVFEMY